MPETSTIPQGPMQITFQNTFDHWVAPQMFSYQCGVLSKKVEKHDNNRYIQFIIVFCVVDAAFFFTYGFNVFFIALTLYILYLILHHPKFNYKGMQAGIYQRLKMILGQEYEEEINNSLQWEVTPEQIIIRSSKDEFRMTMDSIRKIVVCPQYLFVDIGFDKFLSLPRQAVPEPDYSVFCDYLINLYRTHAQQHQKEAVVTQSKWILELSDSEMSALSAQAASESSEGKCSFSKTVVVVLLGILFLIAGFIIIGAMADAMKLF